MQKCQDEQRTSVRMADEVEEQVKRDSVRDE